MKIERVTKDRNYTQIDNRYLHDTRLSLKAIGLFTLILSLPESWEFSIAGIRTICKDGTSSVRAALNELEQFGYLTREQSRDIYGRIGRMKYTFYEVSILPGK